MADRALMLRFRAPALRLPARALRLPALTARVIAAVLFAVLCSACAGVFRVPLAACPVETHAAAPSKVSVQYLGAGGFLFERGDDVLMTAPFYSNPSPVEVALDHQIVPDTELIDALLPKGATRARAILVGHSHYYRLMDVPYVALNKATQADVYGTATMTHLLAPVARALRDKTPSTKLVALDDQAAVGQQPGHWQRVGPGLRFMAIRSEHAPLVALTFRIPFAKDLSVPFRLWRGGATDDRATLPRSASDWVEGSVLAYLIDFLDPSGSVAFRIYYQDSAGSAPAGYVPDVILKEKAVDVAILCAWGDFRLSKDYPEGLIKSLGPRRVIVSQWENLFLDQKLAEATGFFHALPISGDYGPMPVKTFVDHVKRALPRGVPPPLVPCPTRSVFELEVR